MESEKTRNEKINQIDQALKEYAKRIREAHEWERSRKTVATREAAEWERSRKAEAMKPYKKLLDDIDAAEKKAGYQKLLDDIKAAEKEAEYERILDRLLR